MRTKRDSAGCYRRLAMILLVPLFVACSQNGVRPPPVASLEPLDYQGQKYTASQAVGGVPGPDLLALTPEMTEFADRYIRSARTQRQRLGLLHRSLRSSALLNIDYDPGADGSAADAFASGRANCLSYAHLFVALARYSGLDAGYQTLAMRPEWVRHGERVALQMHVNVVVSLRSGEVFMVDIDPVRRDRVARVEAISDAEARALQENNLAMNYLLEERISDAYLSLVRGLRASPRIDYLWVNLGAIYRQTGQDAAAETSYRVALDLNPDSASAMNNLAILYADQGLAEQAAEMEQQVERRRRRNPYYHALLGQKAETERDFSAALAHYRRALELEEDDPELHFRLGQLYMRMGRREDAVESVQEAIARARLVSERSQYETWLNNQAGDGLASLPQGAG